MKIKSMFPDEETRASLVVVYPPLAMSLEPPYPSEEVASLAAIAGQEELRPEFYIPVVRRRGLKWHYEVMKAVPCDGGHISHEVMERMLVERDRIIAEQRSDRGTEQAIARKAAEADAIEVAD